MKLRFIGPALFTTLTLASEVSAEPPPSPSISGRPHPLDEPPRPEVKTVERWYGWHTLLGVAPAATLLVAGLIWGPNDGGDGVWRELGDGYAGIAQ